MPLPTNSRLALAAVLGALLLLGPAGGSGGHPQGDPLPPSSLGSWRGVPAVSKATLQLDELLASTAADAEVDALVTFADGAAEKGRERLTKLASRAPLHLLQLGVSGARLHPAQAREVATWPEVSRVQADLPVRWALNRSAAAVQAPEAWTRLGETGRNATAMIIDTGADATHPDLRGRVTTALAVPRSPLDGTGAVPPPVTDFDGHGTHVAGILAGSGEAFGPSLAPDLHHKYVGVAPEARLIAFGAGATGRMLEVLQGFDWALAHHREAGIRVVSNSWSIGGYGGVNGSFDPAGEVEQAALRLYRAGVAVVFAAGNDGPGDNTLSPTSMPPWVLSVAASTSRRETAYFSSRGVASAPAPSWSHPDITAPGTGVMSARATVPAGLQGPLFCPDVAEEASVEQVLGEQDATRLQAEPLYQCSSGTSMAAPHVSGVIALMASANPRLSPDQMYDLLMDSVDPLPGGYAEVGAGFLNASRAVELARATPGNTIAFLAGDRAYEGATCYADDALARLLHRRGQAPAPCTVPGNAPPDAPAPFPAAPGCPDPAETGLPLVGPPGGFTGEPYSVGLFSLTDFDGDAMRVLVDWGTGDAGASGWLAPGSSVCLTHIYDDPGDYDIRVVLEDDRGARSSPGLIEVEIHPWLVPLTQQFDGASCHLTFGPLCAAGSSTSILGAGRSR